jgi:hypothetical protein
MTWRFAILILFCCAPTVAFADASTFCLYALLLETHAMVSHCGDSLDRTHEKLYQQELAAVKINLLSDSRQAGKTLAERKASIDAYEARMRAQYLSRDQSVCRTKDYPLSRDLLNRLSNTKILAGIRADVKAHKDPDKGECL